jgi:hypothetical protein
MSFSFHANTLAFGGQLEEAGRTRRFLPSQASVTLPPEGGFGESVISDFCENGVSFYRAESHVFGNSFQDRLFKTYANVTVYGLDIAGVLQADVLSASITSINERVANCTSESRISFDATVVGLVINGVPYDVQLDTEPFLKNGTFSEFTSSVTKMDEKQVRTLAAAYNWPFEECRTVRKSLNEGEPDQIDYHVPERCNTGLRATLIKDIVPAFRSDTVMPLKKQGFTIEVPELGLVHLAEVLLTTGRRGINLLRVELGKKLEEPIISAESQPPSTGENRLHAVVMADSAQASGDLGGYTIVHAVGNGTDFGPP